MCLAPLPPAASSSNASTTGAIVGGLMAALVVALILVALRQRRKKQLISPTVVGNKRSDQWEIERSHILLGSVIGEGAFGKTHAAEYINPDSQAVPSVPVVAKVFDPTVAKASGEKGFVAEMNTMKTIGKHENVQSIVGVVTIGRPMILVLEHAGLGILSNHLRTNKSLTVNNLLLFAIQCANGMEYISSLKIVHGNLSADTVVVARGPVCKITGLDGERGFASATITKGMSLTRKSASALMTVKWMAPESLNDLTLTTQADIWSFGVLLWEIFSRGQTPYGKMTNDEILTFLKEGHRLERPDEASVSVEEIMNQCWAASPRDRPTFTDIKGSLVNFAGFDTASYTDTLPHGQDMSAHYDDIEPQYDDIDTPGNGELPQIS